MFRILSEAGESTSVEIFVFDFLMIKILEMGVITIKIPPPFFFFLLMWNVVSLDDGHKTSHLYKLKIAYVLLSNKHENSKYIQYIYILILFLTNTNHFALNKIQSTFMYNTYTV